MKAIIFIIFFTLSLSVLAKDPNGLYQIDSTNSHLEIAEEQKTISGLIDINEVFTLSKFEFQTGQGKFISTSVSGDLQDFVVNGLIITKDETINAKFHGVYFGTNEREGGYEKILFKLESDKCVSSVWAQRPKPSTSELHRTVREIVQ